MTSLVLKFWFVGLLSLSALSAVGLLVLAALFPDSFPMGNSGYIVTATIALISVGILVWQLAVGFGDTLNQTKPPEQE